MTEESKSLVARILAWLLDDPAKRGAVLRADIHKEYFRRRRIKKIATIRQLFAEQGLAVLHMDDDDLLYFVDKLAHCEDKL